MIDDRRTKFGSVPISRQLRRTLPLWRGPLRPSRYELRPGTTMSTQPRKSLLAVGVASALLAAALLVRHTNPEPDDHAPLATKTADLALGAAGKTRGH
jgi:hypothetical protein